jgi:hypothetical protein
VRDFCREVDFPAAKYEAIMTVRERKETEGFVMPVISKFYEYKAFGTALLDMPEKEAQAFLLMQSIMEAKRESEANRG